MVIPKPLCLAVRKIQDTNLVCASVISQWAAVGAMTAGAAFCRRHVEALATVREMVLEKLGTISDIAHAPAPTGAFYCLLKQETDLPAMEIVERLIREHKVAVLPGCTFGIENGSYLRLAYGALEEHTVADGIDRLVNGLKAILG